MTSAVLDASAVLAFLRREPGDAVVAPYLAGGLLGAVNYAEVLGKSLQVGIAVADTERVLDGLGLRCVAFDDTHARIAAELLPITRQSGLSLADRACLALAKATGLPAITAERRWKALDAGVEVRLIRHA